MGVERGAKDQEAPGSVGAPGIKLGLQGSQREEVLPCLGESSQDGERRLRAGWREEWLSVNSGKVHAN